MSYNVDFSKYFVGVPNTNNIEIRNVLPCRFVKVYRNNKLEIDYSAVGKIYTETISVPNSTQYIKEYTSGVNDNRIVLIPRDGNLVGAHNSRVLIMVYWEDGYSEQFNINDRYTNNKLYVDIPNRGLKVVRWYINFENVTNMIFVLFAYRVVDYNNLVGTIENVQIGDVIRVDATNFYSNFPALNYNKINTTYEMGFSIHLFKCSAENIKVDKTNFLTNELVLNGVLREECSITQPIVRIELLNIDTLYNYAYIPKFNRYYYIDNINIIKNKLFEIVLNVDVLMSYYSDIVSSRAMVSRNEFDYDNFLIDNDRPLTGDYQVDFVKCSSLKFNNRDIENLFNYPSYVVSVVGGGVDTPSMNYTYGSLLNLSGSVLYTSYYMDKDGLDKFIDKILNPTFIESLTNMFQNNSDYVVDIKAVPFNLFGYRGVPNSSNMNNILPYFLGAFISDASIDTGKTIKIGDKLITIENCTVGTFSQNPTFHLVSEIDISALNLTNSFIDFYPYSKFELFLPFIGFVNYDIKYAYNNYKYIHYYINSVNGNFIVYLSNNGNQTATVDELTDFVEVYNGEMYLQLGFGSTNANQIHLANGIRAYNLASSIIGTVAGGYTKFVSGGNMLTPKRRVISAKGKLQQSTAIMETQEGVKNSISGSFDVPSIVSENIPTYSGYAPQQGISNYTKFRPFVRIVKKSFKELDLFGDTYYRHLFGKPTLKIDMLLNFSGYTVVKEVHIECNCTSEEKDEIELLLKSGVIL